MTRRAGTAGYVAMVRKDLHRELRGKAGLQAGLVVAVLLLVVYMLNFNAAGPDAQLAAIVVWTPLLYAGVAAAGRGMAAESDAGTLDRLRMAGVEPVVVGLARTTVDVLVTMLVGAAAALVGSWLFGFYATPTLLYAVALGAIGVATVGSLAGALASQSRGRDILPPLLAVPVLVPLVQAGLYAVRGVQQGLELSDLMGFLGVMAGYDIAALAAAWLLWPFILEADA